jgi:predicted RNase H-like HicB family nuclease
MSRKKSKKPQASEYQIAVHWSAEDGCYLAVIPALGCRTHGDTPEKALTAGLEVAELWLRDAWKCGDYIPPANVKASGNISLRLPSSLHRDVALAAQREGTSVNQWLVMTIARGV